MKHSFFKLIPLVLLALFSTACGNITRTVIFTSEPAGANVVLDDIYIGKTSADPTKPLEVEFTFYGEHEAIFYWDTGAEVKMGLENAKGISPRYPTMLVRKEFVRPWYQYFPFEPVAEFIWPTKVTNIEKMHAEFVAVLSPAGDEKAREVHALLTGKHLEKDEKLVNKESMEDYEAMAGEASDEDKERGKAGAIGFRQEGSKPIDIHAEEPTTHASSAFGTTLLILLIMLGL